MKAMIYGALAGLLPGAAAALIGAAFTRYFMKKGDASAITAAMGIRLLLDLLTLGGIFLLRKVIPLPYEAVMLGAALSLTLVGVWQAARISRQSREEDEEQ